MSGFAQELSLSDCLKQAEDHSLQVRQGQSNESQAKEAQGEALGAQRPQLSAYGKYTASDDASTNLPDDNQAVLRVDQNLLPFLSADGVRLGQKDAQVQAASFHRQESEADTALRVKQLYFSILRDKEIIQSLDQVAQELKGLLDGILPRFSVGRVPSFDKVKVQSALVDLARQRDQVSVQLSGEKVQLSQLIGQDAPDSPALLSFASLPVLPTGDEFKGFLDSNPTRQALAGEVQAARIGWDAANWQRIPSLDASFRYGYTGYTWDGLSRGWDATVEMKVPLFDWGQIDAQSNQEKASYQFTETGLELEKQKEEVDLQQAQQTAQSELSDEQRLKTLLPDAVASSHAAVQQYRRGALGIVETTDAVNLWLNTVTNERTAYYGYLSTLAGLERLTGGHYQVNYEQ